LERNPSLKPSGPTTTTTTTTTTIPTKPASHKKSHQKSHPKAALPASPRRSTSSPTTTTTLPPVVTAAAVATAFAPAALSPAPVASTARPGHAAARPSHHSSPAGAGILSNPFVAATGTLWQAMSLRTSVAWPLPVILLTVAFLLAFLLVQGRLDRRDPKMTHAPERSDEHTIGFD
jgi:hypothetical protein